MSYLSDIDTPWKLVSCDGSKIVKYEKSIIPSVLFQYVQIKFMKPGAGTDRIGIVSVRFYGFLRKAMLVENTIPVSGLESSLILHFILQSKMHVSEYENLSFLVCKVKYFRIWINCLLRDHQTSTDYGAYGKAIME